MSLAVAWRVVSWRHVANATWVPLCLLSLSVVLIAVPLLQWPVRLTLNLLPFVVLFLAVWWILHRVAQPRTVNLALGALCVVCIVPAYAESREFRSPVLARLDSPVLWSMTLQHPDQAIGRYIRLPDNWQEEGKKYRLLVRLQDLYKGPARLLVEVNGVPLGSLHPTTSGGDYGATLGLLVPSEVLARQRVAEIILRQDIPDRKLRIVVYREWAGATLGADAAWFYDGTTWHRGVVHALSGRIVPGLPHIWLEHVWWDQVS